MRALLALLLLPISCSSTTPFPSDDIAFPFDGGPDRTLPSEGGSDAAAEADATVFNGGGPFLCLDCTCDGTSRYCAEISGGKAPMVTDAAACDPDAGGQACVAIPIDCLPKPSCACVMAHYTAPCTCDIDPTGNGIVVLCVYP